MKIMSGEQPKIRFYEFLSQPRFGFCRGVLPYNLALLLLFIFFAQQCFARAEEGCGLLYLLSPLLVLAHEIIFRSSRLPKPVAAAYDALFSDIFEQLIAQPFSVFVYSVISAIAAIVRYVAVRVVACFWFVVSLAVSLFDNCRAFLIALTRLAHDYVSIRQSVLLSQSHSIRAPSVVLN